VLGFLLRLLQGSLIGISGILPGVSGGVLCVAFGFYKPIMEVFASPKTKLKEYWKLLLPLGIGAAAGCLGLARLVSVALENYESLATCVFAGLILGTLPSLLRTAGKEKRSAGSYIAFFVSFLMFFALFVYLEYGVGIRMLPFASGAAEFWGFVLAGAIWGISIVLPGLSSSAILLFLGLLEPITSLTKSLDFGILLPLALGGISVILLFSKLANYLYEKHFSVMSHIILGIVVATTIPILPMRFSSLGAAVVQIALLVLGFAVAQLFDWLGKKE